MITEDLNLGQAPFMKRLNAFLDDNPKLSRAIRLVTWMALTEASERCPAIATHTPCTAAMFQRMTTLTILAVNNPEAVDCLLEATRNVMHERFPDMDWNLIESSDEGRVR